MNLINKIKRLWKLSGKDPKSLEEFMKLSDKEIMELPDEDTKAVFISEGSAEEFKDYQNENKGIKGIFGL
jgi:hypothetical protein